MKDKKDQTYSSVSSSEWLSYSEDTKREMEEKTTNMITSWFYMALGVMILIFIFVTVYTHLMTKKLSCYYTGCYHPHRAMIYNYLPDVTEIPKLNETITRKDGTNDDYRLVCYYNFPNEKLEGYQLEINDLDPMLCTHLNVGFASVEDSTIYLEDYQKAHLWKLVGLRKENPDLKVLLSVTGRSNCGFTDMVRNHTTRKRFIRSTMEYVRYFKIDGIDLDWEFPNEVGYDHDERMHFTQLLHEIREEIDRQRKHKFLITVAVPAPYFVAANSYDINYIKDYVDFVNVMTYDFHFYTFWTPYTGINSPLYSFPKDVGIFGTLNINYSVNFWLSQGMPKEKIVVGLPTYGHTYQLMNSRNNGISAPAAGPGEVGQKGFIDYSEVCEFIRKSKVLPYFDEVSKSPFVTSGANWISYDDERSLTYKAEYVKANNLGGAMVYCLNSDDHRGVCDTPLYGNRTKFPLVQTIRDVLLNPKY